MRQTSIAKFSFALLLSISLFGCNDSSDPDAYRAIDDWETWIRK